MKLVKLELLDDKAIDVLKSLEALSIIKIVEIIDAPEIAMLHNSAKYSGAMSKQSMEEIDRQLNELRNG